MKFRDLTFLSEIWNPLNWKKTEIFEQFAFILCVQCHLSGSRVHQFRLSFLVQGDTGSGKVHLSPEISIDSPGFNTIVRIENVFKIIRLKALRWPRNSIQTFSVEIVNQFCAMITYFGGAVIQEREIFEIISTRKLIFDFLLILKS